MSPPKRKDREAQPTNGPLSPAPEESQATEEGPSFLTVGVGASAGGLEAFTQMLRAMYW